MEDYKKLIIETITSISDEKLLRYIYSFVEIAVKRWR